MKIVKGYGVLANKSATLDPADPDHATVEDILGQSRPVANAPDIGAFEFRGRNTVPELLLLCSE